MSSDTTVEIEPASEEAEQTPSTPQSLRATIVKNTGSGYVPVRGVFVQKYEGKNRASTLGKMVKERKRRELILYLLVLAAWDPDLEHAPWAAGVWLRALTVQPKPSLTWSRSSLSETWSDLVTLKLVTRSRERRRSRITPLREDRRAEYTRPDGKTEAERYFTLPGEFWTDMWFDRLSLPGVAVLLILLKETNKSSEVHFTYATTAKWYGFSESTAKAGYQELSDVGLLEFRDELRRSDYAELGLTKERYYKLTGAFSTETRQAARTAADKERKRRARAVSGPKAQVGDAA